MPLQATSGAASYDGFGGGVAAVPNYIEEVFSTYLYTGNGSTQTITNGIDLSGKGGLVWIKKRSAAGSHCLFDTARGTLSTLFSNATNAATTVADTLTAFNSNGFNLGIEPTVNGTAATEVSWTFRKQPKFFDVVTYTGNGTSSNIVSHALASQPAFIITKRTDSTGQWIIWHRTGTTWLVGYLNTTDPLASAGSINASVTSTQVNIGSVNATSGENANISGASYVMYLFAHDAGGFGLTGTDNVISCGAYTTDVNGLATVNLGYEPQWVLNKRSSEASNWIVVDNMRGFTTDGGTNQQLYPNTSGAEIGTTGGPVSITPTGFTAKSGASVTNIYIAIRRGPMKVPTSGTSVLGLSARTGTGSSGSGATVTGGAGVTDLAIIKRRDASTNWVWTPRLTGTGYLSSNLTAAEVPAGTTILQPNPWDVMDGVKVGTTSVLTNASGAPYINYLIDRAPGFMDVVCYTGTGANLTLSHNLQAVPELVITKKRSAINEWYVTHSFTVTGYKRQYLEQTAAASSHLYSDNFVFTAQPTTTSLFYGSNSNVNESGQTFVNYLFATCAGVSKVGSYTGTGATQTIACGFTGGARFVLVKRTDTTGGWNVWDTARGMVAGTDPSSLLQSAAAENNINSIYTTTGGFQIVSTAVDINASGGTYIFLAIA